MCGPDWSKDTAQPGDTLFWSSFCDTRTARGFFRKQSTLKTNQGIGQIKFNGQTLPIGIQTKNLIPVTSNPDDPSLLSGVLMVKNQSGSPLTISYLSNIQQLKISSSLNSQPVTLFRDSETEIMIKVSASALVLNNHFQLSFTQGEKTWLVDYYLHLP